MNQQKDIDLYSLLPTFYRSLDAERGYPLKAIVDILSEQANQLKGNIEGLWDDFFIETCADWVVPYIGDLVGTTPLHEVAQSRRIDVAKTISYRRRKGTLSMLEELARDVTGWSVHAVEFFELLGWTQYLNHVRHHPQIARKQRSPGPQNPVGTVDLRNIDALDCLDGPFDTISHTADVRRMDGGKGKHNIRNIGFFVWRLYSYSMVSVPPRRASLASEDDYGYHFSPLGNPAPLFNNPQDFRDDQALATELNVPGPIRPLALLFDLERAKQAAANGDSYKSDFIGPDASVNLRIVENSGDPPADRVVPPEDFVLMDLGEWDAPPADKVGIDVERGRFVFAPSWAPSGNERVEVSYNYGFSADIGGGPYDRRESLNKAEDDDKTLGVEVRKRTEIDTLQKALEQWLTSDYRHCIIEILDNEVYGGNIDIVIPAGSPIEGERKLTIQAADGKRPVLRTVGTFEATVEDTPEDEGDVFPALSVNLNGLLIEGAIELGDNVKLIVEHCTFVPGHSLEEDGSPTYPDRDSVVVAEGAFDVEVVISKSVVGPIRLPHNSRSLLIQDSIVDASKVEDVERPAIAADDAADEPGPPTTIERTTVFGDVYVKELTLASEVIFSSPVRAERTQAGCARFSYLPLGSETPRRYRCQPDLALENITNSTEEKLIRTRLAPSFTSIHYGEPAYAQLAARSAEELRTGAEDGSEMGAFCHLKQPQREQNLRIRLEEYLPFGLAPGLYYVS